MLAIAVLEWPLLDSDRKGLLQVNLTFVSLISKVWLNKIMVNLQFGCNIFSFLLSACGPPPPQGSVLTCVTAIWIRIRSIGYWCRRDSCQWHRSRVTLWTLRIPHTASSVDLQWKQADWRGQSCSTVRHSGWVIMLVNKMTFQCHTPNPPLDSIPLKLNFLIFK